MAGVEGGPTLNAVVGGGQPPSHPSSLQLQVGPPSGTADFPGAANHPHHPPHAGEKKKVFLSCDCHFLSHCGSWDVCCWLPWRWPL